LKPVLKPVPTQLSVSVLDQVRMDESPEVILVGSAERVAVGAGAAALTDTVTLSDALPPGPVHDIEYVVLLVGETETDPDVALPVLKFVPVQLSASVLDQVSVDESPEVMEVGDAERDAVGAGAAALTDTVTLSDALPPGPVHDIEYVVLLVGETETDPDVASPVLKPEPVQMPTLVLDQVRVDEPPEVMEVGDAERVAVGSAQLGVVKEPLIVSMVTRGSGQEGSSGPPQVPPPSPLKVTV